MKLLRFEYGGGMYVGKLVDDLVVMLEGDVLDPGKETGDCYGFSDIRFLPPVYPSKIICVGFNYRRHMDEAREIATKQPTLT